MRVLRPCRAGATRLSRPPDKRLPDCEGIETLGHMPHRLPPLPDKRLPDCEGIETAVGQTRSALIA